MQLSTFRCQRPPSWARQLSTTKRSIIVRYKYTFLFLTKTIYIMCTHAHGICCINAYRRNRKRKKIYIHVFGDEREREEVIRCFSTTTSCVVVYEYKSKRVEIEIKWQHVVNIVYGKIKRTGDGFLRISSFIRIHYVLFEF